MVSVAPVSALVAAKLAAVAAPDAVSVPGACGRERCAGNARCVHARREHVRAVHVVAQQLVAAHVALRGEPVQRGRVQQSRARWSCTACRSGPRSRS